MRAEWVESLLAQCRERGVPFFFKQWGGVQKHRTGRTLGGRTYDEMPEMRRAAVGRLKSRAPRSWSGRSRQY